MKGSCRMSGLSTLISALTVLIFVATAGAQEAEGGGITADLDKLWLEKNTGKIQRDLDRVFAAIDGLELGGAASDSRIAALRAEAGLVRNRLDILRSMKSSSTKTTLWRVGSVVGGGALVGFGVYSLVAMNGFLSSYNAAQTSNDALFYRDKVLNRRNTGLFALGGGCAVAGIMFTMPIITGVRKEQTAAELALKRLDEDRAALRSAP